MRHLEACTVCHDRPATILAPDGDGARPACPACADALVARDDALDAARARPTPAAVIEAREDFN